MRCQGSAQKIDYFKKEGLLSHLNELLFSLFSVFIIYLYQQNSIGRSMNMYDAANAKS